ncbi:MAG: hypothetical protein JW779_13050 [Candidatus Thorarchaeota archaeon]|nr:hypothetical protein [Candidatus Thorarchaeota archaeon]
MKTKRFRMFAFILLMLGILLYSLEPPCSYTPTALVTPDSVPILENVLEESRPTIHDSIDSVFGHWSLSDISIAPPIRDILEPALVEQSGYSSTGNVSARTDSSVNTQGSLSIDTAHNWVASTAEIDIWNLEKLYVVNGTFDEGSLGYTVSPNGTLEHYPLGWSAVSTNSDPDQVQRVSYEEIGERYITIQNQAEVTNNPQHQYTHYAGTSVLWNQTFYISPYTDEFLLSFNYLYLQGPLTSIFSGDFSLQVFIDGDSVYSIDLPTLSSRGTWYSTGLIPINKAILSDSTMFMIGLVIDSTFLVDVISTMIWMEQQME